MRVGEEQSLQSIWFPDCSEYLTKGQTVLTIITRLFSVIHKFPKTYASSLWVLKALCGKDFFNIISCTLRLWFSSFLLAEWEDLKRREQSSDNYSRMDLCCVLTQVLGVHVRRWGTRYTVSLWAVAVWGEVNVYTASAFLGWQVPASYFWEVKTAQSVKPLRVNLLGWYGDIFTWARHLHGLSRTSGLWMDVLVTLHEFLPDF